MYEDVLYNFLLYKQKISLLILCYFNLKLSILVIFEQELTINKL